MAKKQRPEQEQEPVPAELTDAERETQRARALAEKLHITTAAARERLRTDKPAE